MSVQENNGGGSAHVNHAVDHEEDTSVLEIWKTGLKQTGFLIRKNFILAYRKKKSTIIQILIPFVFVLGLYLIQLAVDQAIKSDYDIANSPFSRISSIPTNIPKCTPHPDKKYCYTFIYAPSGTPQIESLIEGVIDETGLTRNDVKGFSTEGEIDTWLLSNPNITQAAYIFLNNATLSFEYSIQYNQSIPECNDFGSCFTLEATLVAPMQVAMDRQIMRQARTLLFADDTKIDISWAEGKMAHPQLPLDDGIDFLGSIFFFAAMMFLFVVLIQEIVSEKETKLREGMRMMGLIEGAYYLSWFFTYFVMTTFAVFILIASGHIFDFTFFTKSDFGTYFFLFFIFGISIICAAFFLASLIERSQAASTMGFLIFIICAILQTFIPGLLYVPGKSVVVQGIFSLISPIVFAKALGDLTQSSVSGRPGLRWDDIAHNDTVFPVLTVYKWLIFDSALYMVLGWYIDNVFPGQYGTPKPFYFLFLPSYWTGRQSNQKQWAPSAEITRTPIEDDDVKLEEERVLAGKTTYNDAVVITNLVKVYRASKLKKSKSDFIAVKGVTLTFPRNQLFCLLGPNGAGKTTTLSMLTGLFGPSDGDAIILGHSIRTDMPKIRKFMGVCPQHDLLWPMLTGLEHLILYASFKGMNKEEALLEAETRLKEVGMYNVRNLTTSVYSGGERRRLSVAIALTGDPKIVFLDEPTTGMDTIARRQVWNIIEKSKKDRVIILTTHSMEEADILSDKIGIMANGRLRCLGDNIHLKNKFGAGYVLHVFSQELQSDELVSRITTYVQNGLPGSTLIGKNVGSLSYQIPRSMTGNLAQFFTKIEEDLAVIGVDDIAVNLSTLEEVFLRIAENSQSDGAMKVKESDPDNTVIDEQEEITPL
eukprot:TRINITY_DN4331_c0_g1_i7.p1 TRINITY_DN4331_c0_g1~~TRINITY_DN4331_c0_g1_i7.p1  ORF type:complete len:875 (-),score=184.80 TRINITY_DN4331_c0_g1_i7:65-2689(-)